MAEQGAPASRRLTHDRALFGVSLLVLLALALFAPPMVAQEIMQVAQEMPGFKASMSYQDFGNGESVNLSNGGLTVTHASGISLPQNMGGTLRPTRVYNSKNQEIAWEETLDGYDAPLYGPLGADWSISFGRVLLRLEENILADNSGEYHRNRPMYFYRDESGAEHRLYPKGSLDTYNGEYDPPKDGWYVTNDGSYIRARLVITAAATSPNQTKLETSLWEIYYPDGSVRTAGGVPGTSFFQPTLQPDNYPSPHWSRTRNAHWNGWYVTKIKDRAGNTNTVTYKACPTPNEGAQPYPGAIDKVSDHFGRAITFHYGSDALHLLASIRGAGMTETFSYHTVGSSPLPRLRKVHAPDGLDVYYSYLASPDTSRHLLSAIGYPTGAVSEYMYGTFRYPKCRFPRNPAQANCDQEEDTDVVTGRRLTAAAPNPDDDSYPAVRPTSGLNTLVWTYERTIPGQPSTATAYAVTVRDPMGTAQVHTFATEQASRKPPATELTVRRYHPGRSPVPGAPDAGAALVTTKEWAHDDGPLDRGDACLCMEAVSYNGTTPVIEPVRFGNPRAVRVQESERDAAGNALWSKTTQSPREAWDGFGHYRFTWVEAVAHQQGAPAVTTYPVTATAYELRVDFTATVYQTDRLTLSYSGENVDPPYVVAPPPFPNSLDIEGEYRAVSRTYDADTGLLKSQTSHRAVQTTFEMTMNEKDLPLSAPNAGAGDKLLQVGYTTMYNKIVNGNIKSLTYSGGDGPATFGATFDWEKGMVKTMTWNGAGYPEFTRTIEAATSRITGHRDASGLLTQFQYYADGRLRKVTPPGGEHPEQILYPSETWYFEGLTDQPWTVGHMIQHYKGPGTIPDLRPGSTAYVDPAALYTVYTFDDLGRMWRRNGRRPEGSQGGRWTEALTLYDPMGRAVFTSDPYERGEKTSFVVNPPVGHGESYTLHVPRATPQEEIAYGTWDLAYGGATLAAPFPESGGALETFYRTREILAADGGRASILYDGLKTTKTEYPDAGPAVTTTWKDALGRLRTVDAPAGADATYTYDGLGNLVRAVLDSQERTFSYDALGRLTMAHQPESGALTGFKYDAIGNVLEYLDAKGVKVGKSYDAKGRPRSLEVTQQNVTSLVASWFYDEGSAGPYSRNRLTRARASREDGTGIVEEAYAYGRSDGRLGSKSLTISGLGTTSGQAVPTASFTLGFDYDAMGQITSESFRRAGADHLFTMLSTHERGALTEKRFADGSGVNEVTYRASGAMEEFRFVSGPTVTYEEEDLRARLASITATGLQGQISLWETGTYQYDGAGNITHIGGEHFTYDKAHRLMTARVGRRRPGGAIQYADFGYSYDAWGNLEGRTASGTGWMGPEEAAFLDEAVFTAAFGTSGDPDNRLSALRRREGTNIPFDHDANGNLTVLGTNAMTYDALNQTRRVQGTGGAWQGSEEYVYDAAGERAAVVRRNAAGAVQAVEYFVRAGALVLGEEKVAYGDGGPTASTAKAYLYAGASLAATQEATAYNVSGRVTLNGQPLAGVKVAAGAHSATTGADGQYTLAWMAEGRYAVVPALTGYGFTPEQRPVEVGPSHAGVDFAAAPLATLRGTVRSLGDGAPLPGVSVSAAQGGVVVATATTDAQGVYTMAVPAETYALVPTAAAHCFDPATATVTVTSGGIREQNFAAIPKWKLTTAVTVNGSAAGVTCRVIGAASGSLHCPGASVTLTATCNTSPFDKWLVAVGASSPVERKEYPLTLAMTADTTVTAVFSCILYSCSHPPPANLVAGDAGGLGDGTYRVHLSWESEDAEGRVFQVAMRPLSAYFESYSPLMEPIREFSSCDVTVAVPRGCEDYVFRVRSYDPAEEVFSPWSEPAVARSTPVEPSAPVPVRTACITLLRDSATLPGGRPTQMLGWSVSESEACAITGFLVERGASDSTWSPVAEVAANGGTSYQLALGACPTDLAPPPPVRVAARMGDLLGPWTVASVFDGPSLEPVRYTYETTLSQPDVSVGDLTGDVAYDLVLQTALFRANPDGTFTPDAGPLQTAAGDGDRVRLADLDGDGLLDRVVAHNRTLWVEYGAGGGAFSLGPAIQLAEPVGDFAVGYVPLNLTRTPQVVAGSKTRLTVLDLSGGSWRVREEIPTDLDVSSLALGDLNNDGLTDVLAGGKRGVRLAYAAEANLGAWSWEVVSPEGPVPCVDLADADGDGFLDVATARQRKDAPLVWLFRPLPDADPSVRPLAHTWEPGELEEGFDLPNVRRVLFADLDNSGLPGVFCVAEEAHKSQYLRNDGNGGLMGTELVLDGTVLAAAAGDFDGDGTLDLVTAGNKTLDVYEGSLTPVYAAARAAMGASRADAEREESSEAPPANLPPSWPELFDARVRGSLVELSWYPAPDDGTPEGSMTYEVMAGEAPLDGGLYRGEVGPGDTCARQGNVRTLTRALVPFPGTLPALYWAVRAVDSSLLKGPWLIGVTLADGATEPLGVVWPEADGDPEAAGMPYAGGPEGLRGHDPIRPFESGSCPQANPQAPRTTGAWLRKAQADSIAPTEPPLAKGGQGGSVSPPAGVGRGEGASPSALRGRSAPADGLRVLDARTLRALQQKAKAEAHAYGPSEPPLEQGGRGPSASSAPTEPPLEQEGRGPSASSAPMEPPFGKGGQGGFASSPEAHPTVTPGLIFEATQTRGQSRDLDQTPSPAGEGRDEGSASPRSEALYALKTLYYITDHLGTVRVVVQRDPSTGLINDVASLHDYEPYGVQIRPTSTTAGNTHQYTGHERDANTGLDYMHARFYGASLGRFMKPDNGMDQNRMNPQSWNLYSYVRNNPVNSSDPTGHAGIMTDWNVLGKEIAAAALKAQQSDAARATQGGAASLGTQATQDAAARQRYVEASSKLKQGEPGASAARTALKQAARQESTPAGQAIAEAMRPAAGEAARAAGSVAKTNEGVNAAMGVAGKAGPVLMVAGAAVSVANVATAPEGEKCRATAQESGAWLGALTFGVEGAKGGALVGLAFGGPPGGGIGAVAGAIGGGIVGAFAGEKAAENVFDATTPQ